METTTCPHCARPRPSAGAAGLAWASLHGPDGRMWFICPECTRGQLSEIETGASVPPPSRHTSAA